MSQDFIDPVSILASLEAKYTALGNLIASWKAALSVGALGPAGEGGAVDLTGTVPNGVSIELPAGALSNKSIPAAIKLYLASVKRKQTIRQIASALKEGGMESTSANFETVVTGSLNRLKEKGEVLRFSDGWNLAEHYPEHLRAKISQERKPSIKKPRKTKKHKKTEIAPAPAAVPASAPKPNDIGNVTERVRKFVCASGRAVSAQEIATALGATKIGVVFALGRIAKRHEIERCPDGTYKKSDARQGRTGEKSE